MANTPHRYNARSGSIQRDIDQAIHRIYQEYGADLSAFVQAIEARQSRERDDRAGKKRADQIVKQRP